MLVSELEKKAETKIRMANAPKSRPSDVSFKSGFRLYDYGVEMVEKKRWRHNPDLISAVFRRAPLLRHRQQQLQHQLGAKKSEYHEAKRDEVDRDR